MAVALENEDSWDEPRAANVKAGGEMVPVVLGTFVSISQMGLMRAREVGPPLEWLVIQPSRSQDYDAMANPALGSIHFLLGMNDLTTLRHSVHRPPCP